MATKSADVIAYFAGSDASYDNQIGLLVNGTLTAAGYGLDDHNSYIGQAFDFGHADVGDSLVFDLRINNFGTHVYSDPSLNAGFDLPGYTGGNNHVYATPYTATSPVFGNTPAGYYVAFEDQTFPASDHSYADENFVFSNVRVGTAAGVATAPEPSAVGMMAVGAVTGLGLFRRRLRAVVG